MQENTKKWLLVALFICLFFSVRLYFYQSPLVGEEGMFAEIAVNHPKAPEFLLHGRIDGQNLYHWPAHPIGMYYIIRAVGSFFSPLINQVPWQDDAKITPLLRFIFSLYQFVVFLGILLLVFRNKTPLFLAVLIFIAVVISPTAVITSANLQTDGSVGALMSGLFALALLYVLFSRRASITPRIGLFAASFFLATGKQEWSFIALIALFLAALYMYLFRSREPVDVKKDASLLLLVLAGFLAGNLFSYLLDPQCYLGGFRIFWTFSDADGLLEGQFDLQKWQRLTISRLRWICIPIALAGISGLLAVSKIKRLKTLEVLLLFFGVGLLGAYFLSNFNPEPRYFAPSLVVLAITVVALLPSKINPGLFASIAVITVLMFIANGIFLFNNIVKKPQKPYFDATRITLRPDQIAILTTADVWNNPDIDFANYNGGKKNAEAFARRYNKVLYPEGFVWWSDVQTNKDENQQE